MKFPVRCFGSKPTTKMFFSYERQNAYASVLDDICDDGYDSASFVLHDDVESVSSIAKFSAEPCKHYVIVIRQHFQASQSSLPNLVKLQRYVAL